jgi:hypothetical protein
VLAFYRGGAAVGSEQNMTMPGHAFVRFPLPQGISGVELVSVRVVEGSALVHGTTTMNDRSGLRVRRSKHRVTTVQEKTR